VRPHVKHALLVCCLNQNTQNHNSSTLLAFKLIQLIFTKTVNMTKMLKALLFRADAEFSGSILILNFLTLKERMMKKILTLSMASLILVMSFSTKQANAASTTADALQTVTAAISIAKVSDLDFGTGAQGDGAKAVAPGAAENAENASFTVTGEASQAYTISLPADGSVVMSTGGGGTADTEIGVEGFTSFPDTTGTLGAGGTETLYVGATRDALRATQTPGSYSGVFTVTVVY